MIKLATTSLVTALFVFATVTHADTVGKPSQYDQKPVHSRSYDEDGTAMSRPNAISVEILGRGLLYSFDYDRSLSDEFGVGIGFSAYSLSADNSSASAFIIPLYGNFYFQPGPSRGFLSLGFDVVTVSANLSDASFTGSGIAPIIGGGYEYRGDSGFLFRAAPYLLVSSRVYITLGLSFGYAF